MNPLVLTHEDLCKISRLGPDTPADRVARWATANGIRFKHDGRGGIWTTIDALNAAVGLKPNQHQHESGTGHTEKKQIFLPPNGGAQEAKRGRKRTFNPHIPSHIDQNALPTGVYWENSGGGRWRMREMTPGGKRTLVTVASGNAALSDLHAIVEQRAGRAAMGTVQRVAEAFMKSSEWAELSAGTQRDYLIHNKIACKTPTIHGVSLGDIQVDDLSTPEIQKLIESINKGNPESKPGAGDAVAGRPSTANHLLRYLRRLFAWGVRLGECQTNPAQGVRQAAERKRNTMPTVEAFARMVQFARERGSREARTLGSVPPYLASVMSLAFRLRMRGIEVVRLSEGDATKEGIVVRRVKGSRDNVVAWTPELREAWHEALIARNRTLSSKANASRPILVRPEHRPIFVGTDGARLSKGALDQAMQALMLLAIREKAIAPQDRFSLHGLKHLGITKTTGNRADKQTASGHKSAAMLDVYDHEKPIVAPAFVPGIGLAEAEKKPAA